MTRRHLTTHLKKLANKDLFITCMGLQRPNKKTCLTLYRQENVLIFVPLFGSETRYTCYSVWVCLNLSQPVLACQCHSLTAYLKPFNERPQLAIVDLQMQIWLHPDVQKDTIFTPTSLVPKLFHPKKCVNYDKILFLAKLRKRPKRPKKCKQGHKS